MDGCSSFLLLPPNGINFRSLLGKITSIVSSPPPRKEVTFSVHVCRINSIRVVRGGRGCLKMRTWGETHSTSNPLQSLSFVSTCRRYFDRRIERRKPTEEEKCSIDREKEEGRKISILSGYGTMEKGRGERRVPCSRGSKEESLPLSTIFSASLSYRWIKIHPMPLVSEQTFLK